MPLCLPLSPYPEGRLARVAIGAFFFSFLLLLPLGAPARAACPPGDSSPITSGDPAAGPLVVITGLGPGPTGSFFLLGAGDAANSGALPVGAWLREAGDVDGDGRSDWYVD